MFVFIWLKLVKILVVCSLLFDNSKNLILQFFAASLIFLRAFRAELDQARRVLLLFVFLRMTQQLTWQLLRSLSLTKTMLLWFGVVVVSERNSNFFWPWQQGKTKKHGKRIDLWHNFKSRQFSTVFSCWFCSQYCTVSKFWQLLLMTLTCANILYHMESTRVAMESWKPFYRV